MATFDYTDTFNYPAAAVFAALANLEARPTWIAGILEVRVTPVAHPVGRGVVGAGF